MRMCISPDRVSCWKLENYQDQGMIVDCYTNERYKVTDESKELIIGGPRYLITTTSW